MNRRISIVIAVTITLVGFAAGIFAGVSTWFATAPPGAEAQDAMICGHPQPNQAPVIRGIFAGDNNDYRQINVAWCPTDATYYRIGWTTQEGIAKMREQGREWLDAFRFVDVANVGQQNHEISNLAGQYGLGNLPVGPRYAFIVGAMDQRFGPARWSEWYILEPPELVLRYGRDHFPGPTEYQVTPGKYTIVVEWDCLPTASYSRCPVWAWEWSATTPAEADTRYHSGIHLFAFGDIDGTYTNVGDLYHHGKGRTSYIAEVVELYPDRQYQPSHITAWSRSVDSDGNRIESSTSWFAISIYRWPDTP